MKKVAGAIQTIAHVLFFETIIILGHVTEVLFVYFPFCHGEYRKGVYSRAEI